MRGGEEIVNVCSIVAIEWEPKPIGQGGGVTIPGLLHWVEWEPEVRWRHHTIGSTDLRAPWSPNHIRDAGAASVLGADWASSVIADLLSNPPRDERDVPPLIVVVSWVESSSGYRLSIGARDSKFFPMESAVSGIHSPPDWFDRSLFPELAVFEVMNS